MFFFYRCVNMLKIILDAMIFIYHDLKALNLYSQAQESNAFLFILCFTKYFLFRPIQVKPFDFSVVLKSML